MGKPAVDPNQCRHCKLRAPEVVIPLNRGKPRGICIACRRTVDQRRRIKSNLYAGFYNTAHNLTSANYKVLSGLMPGAYSLTHRGTRAVEGYIVFISGYLFVSIWKRKHLFNYDLFGVATFLGNLNVFIGKSVPLVAPDGAPIGLERVGEGMIAEDVNEALVMYDQRLRDYAVKRIRTEMAAEARAARKAKAFNKPPTE